MNFNEDGGDEIPRRNLGESNLTANFAISTISWDNSFIYYNSLVPPVQALPFNNHHSEMI